jgi:hypothetical protein
MIDRSDIRTPSPHFVRKLSAALVTARRRRRSPRWLMARRSNGQFSRLDLRNAETGRLPLQADTVAELTRLYGIDPSTVLPIGRTGLDITSNGLISSGGVTVPFAPDDGASLVTAYVGLTRTLRQLDDTEPMPLRRDDVQAIATFLDHSGMPSTYLEAVLAASLAERRVMAGSLIAGAASIGLTEVDRESFHSSSAQSQPMNR